MNLFVVIIVFIIIAFVTAFVLNLNKEKKFENSLSEGEIKTKMLYIGSLAHYLMVVSETNTVINKLHTIITRN